jgi:hypothetical protein
MTLEFRRTDALGGYQWLPLATSGCRAGQVTRTEFHESRSISDVTPRMDTQLLLKMADEELRKLYCSQNIISLLNRRVMG